MLQITIDTFWRRPQWVLGRGPGVKEATRFLDSCKKEKPKQNTQRSKLLEPRQVLRTKTPSSAPLRVLTTHASRSFCSSLWFLRRYLHLKSSIYYAQKDGDPKAFRKVEDDDDPVIRKMKQSEEMRKAFCAQTVRREHDWPLT